MKYRKHILTIILLLVSFFAVSQKDSIKVKKKKLLQLVPVKHDALSPARAAFYSAILPGAGQVYNNRYWWQLPTIYGGLGISFYFYSINNKAFKRYREAYRLRKSGLRDEFTSPFNGQQFISDAGLENAQRQTQKNRDLSLLSAILVYVLQIVEASVTAHLLKFDTSDNLSLQPTTIQNPTFEELPKVGLSIKYTF